MQGNITSHGLLQNNNTFVPVMIRAVPIPSEEELVQNQVPNFPKLEYYNREDVKDLNSKKKKSCRHRKRNVSSLQLQPGRYYSHVPSGSFNVSRGVELNISFCSYRSFKRVIIIMIQSLFSCRFRLQKVFKMKTPVNQITVKVKSLDDLQYCKQLILQTISSADFDSSLTAGSYFSVRTIAEEQANFLARA